MSKIYFFFSFFCIFSSISLQAQENLEVLLKDEVSAERIRILNRQVIKIIEIIETPVHRRQEKVDSLLNKTRVFAKKNNDKQLLKEAVFLRKNTMLNLEPDLQKKIKGYKHILDSLQSPEDDLYKGLCLQEIGQAQFVLGEYRIGFENLLNAKKTFNEIGYENVPKITKYLHGLALNYYFFKNYEEAIQLMKTSIKLPKFSINIDIQRYNTLGMAYFKLDKQDSALVYLNKAYQKAEIYQDTIWMGIIAGNIGESHYKKKDYKKALHYFFKDYHFNKNTYQHPEVSLNTRSNLAKLYLATDSLKKAYTFIKLTENYFPKSNLFKHGEQQHFETAKKQYYENSYQYYSKTKNYQKALIYQDSLMQAKTAANVKYNTAVIKMSKDNLLLHENEIEIALQKQEKSDLRLRYTILILSISILAGLGFGLLYTTRLKKTKEKQMWLMQQEMTELEKQKLENELKRAKADVERFVQKVSEKNDLVESITRQLKKLKKGQDNEQKELTNTLINLRNTKILTDDDWVAFKLGFHKLYPNFSSNVKTYIPNITPSELRYLMLTKIDFSHKEMANALGVSTNAIAVNKHRIRKKLQLKEQETLQQWVNSFSEKAMATILS